MASNRSAQLCESACYHVYTRGVGHQIIFECDEDRRSYLALAWRALSNQGIEVIAWCLMENHTHFLLRGDLKKISLAMQSLDATYARYFNDKYECVGHLFQGHFASKPIISDEQLLTTIRYIHRNPEEIESGLFSHYPWSSYLSYLTGPHTDSMEYILRLFPSLDEFIRFHREETDAQLPEQTLYDKELLAKFRYVVGPVNPFSIRSLPKSERNRVIAKLRGAGLSIRQIERLTSIGRGVISRVVPKM